MSLSIYEQYGFKLFLCKADKSPDTAGSWQDEKNHITRETAEAFQQQGKMIGAWIPEDVIILDLDRHPGKADGVDGFRAIKEQYNIHVNFVDDTLCVKTMSGGFHVFFCLPGNADSKTFKQGAKAPGIDLKTHSGYVIAAGSPGYSTLCEADPMELPDEIVMWLESCEKKGQGLTAGGKTGKAKAEGSGFDKPQLLPVSQLKRILKKIQVENFRNNDRWQSFVTACIATSGDSAEVVRAVDEWSKSDPDYANDHDVVKRIDSFKQQGGITVGTFINFLREEGISNYMIRTVVKFDSLNAILIEQEAKEYQLPFNDPDYQALSYLPEAEEFFNFRGNTAAASLLAVALREKVIFVEGEEKRFYFFNGSKWDRLTDIHGCVHTVLYRIMKFKYAEKRADGQSDLSDKFFNVITAIADTSWKMNSIREFSGREGIFHDIVQWDSPAIKETVTTTDGVIDFRKGQIRKREGLPQEFRRSFVPYTTEEIMSAGKPEKYIEFLHEIFPNADTFETARYSSSTFISGNANRRTFHIWIGEGANGKSTWIDILKKAIGDKAITYDVKLLLPEKFSGMGTTPELAKFEGAYAAFGVEVDRGKRFSSGIIKNLTGGDTISVNPKYRAAIELDATWQLIFACNDLPSFNANDPAFINRLLILPFNMRYWKNADDKKEAERKGTEEQYIVKAGDRDEIINSTLAERAGIIKMMIQDYVEMVSKKDGVIPESKECKKHKNAYIGENDILGEFLRENCEIDGACTGNYFVKSSAITEAYQNYTGFKKASSTAVTKDIIKYDKRVERGVRNKSRGLLNIKLKIEAGSEMDFGGYDEVSEGIDDDDIKPFG